LAVSGRPGPVHFEVPSDVPRAICEDGIGRSFFAGIRRTRGLGPAPAHALDAAIKMIAAAARPVMLVGPGARLAGQQAITALAEAADLPVVVTPKAKGLLAEGHPLFGGVIEMLGKKHIVQWLGEADTFVYVGFDPVELDMLWEQSVPGVLLDEVPDTDAYYRVDVEVIGSISQSIAAMVARAIEGQASGNDHGNGDGKGNAFRGRRSPTYGSSTGAECRSTIEAGLLNKPAPGLLSPREAIEAVRQAADRPDAIVTTDVGAHKMAVGQLWRSQVAGCFLMSNGQSSMGYGLPSAMAAKLVFPGRQVVAVIGDGGLGMYLGELETIARLGLSLPIVVMADNQLTLIAMGQERRGYDRYGVAFGNPDFSGLAASMGGHGVVISSADELEREVRAAWDRPTFSLIAVPVDDQLYRA
jgi:acetolactate synthase I/II/III large subunit